MEPFLIHVRTLGGLEGVLAEELRALGAGAIQRKSRLVTCTGDLAMLYKINVWCRAAIRVLRPLHSFPAEKEEALYDGVKAVDWSKYLKPTGTLAVAANIHSTFTTHSLFVAQLTKDAIVDQFREKTGERPSVSLDEPDLRVVVTLYKQTGQVYVDASGDSLHKRGYRLKAGDAPLGETLAAGILKLAEWNPKLPLVDPMCGSGTFLIEAGLMARNRAPGLLRTRYGFQRWDDYDKSLYESLLSEARAQVRDDVKVTLVGVEIDPETAAIARENVARAGLADTIRIHDGDFFKFEDVPKEPGYVVTNPPYGERLAVQNIGPLYRGIGDRLKSHFPGWNAFVLSGNPEALRDVGIPSQGSLPLFNGAIECELVKYTLGANAILPELGGHVIDVTRWKDKTEAFTNRFTKNVKHLSKWAKREELSCYRLYDKDIPELPFTIDRFNDWLHFIETPRNHDRTPLEHTEFMQQMVAIAAKVAVVNPDKVHFKLRGGQKTPGSSAKPDHFFKVTEANAKFYVNPTDFFEVGLPLEYRKLRKLIEKEAQGKDFLDLFSYTGTFSVMAALGGAKSTTQVDFSNVYLEWAEHNLELNGFKNPKHTTLKEDVGEFLRGTSKLYDLGVIDAPTRSVNRATGTVFELGADHPELLRMALTRLRPGGVLYFLVTAPNFRLSETVTDQVKAEEISGRLLSLDFEKKTPFRCWKIVRPL